MNSGFRHAGRTRHTDISDFDGPLPASISRWNLKRLAASLAVAALDANLPDKKARDLAGDTVQSLSRIHPRTRHQDAARWHTRMDFDREVKRIADDKLREFSPRG